MLRATIASPPFQLRWPWHSGRLHTAPHAGECDMTALIVDDEPLARARLRRLLEGQDVQIVGEADNASTALQMAEDLKPEIVFLDIQMPGLTGMQMASAILHLEMAPLLVFVTGYSEHALEAIEHGALDYLLKPVSLERLIVTLGRVRERLSDRRA